MNPLNLKPEQFEHEFKATTFKPWRLILVVLCIMLFISYAITWYSQAVTLPRFCKDPDMAVHHLEEIITQKTPTGSQYKQRKPYIIAAKLIYLVPQKSNESITDYIYRVRIELNQRCML